MKPIAPGVAQVVVERSPFGGLGDIFGSFEEANESVGELGDFAASLMELDFAANLGRITF